MGDADIVRLVAPNPGPMTLEGTNSYLLGSGPATVIDPGPADRGHIDRLRRTAESRGGVGTVLLTHTHGDHADGVDLLGVEPTSLADGESAGALTAVATPGHADDHLCFWLEPAGDHGERPICFTGDLILGRGYSFVPPAANGGSLSDYLDSLRRIRELGAGTLLPGHGPAIEDPSTVIDDYLEHRLERERRLVEALEGGQRSRGLLLAEVWDDVPPELRGAAAVVMQAHLEKLADEGRLPAGIED